MPKPDRFRFRDYDNIGAMDAEEDLEFLQSCYVDDGQLAILRDTHNPRRIVLGRTGAGKTALLLKLAASEDRVIVIEPESLSMGFVANSTILSFLAKLDVKLDIFFRMLWRHVFSVELIQKRYNLHNKVKLTLKLFNTFRDSKHKDAIDYLEDWGKKFWQETDHRVKEITQKLEREVSASVRAEIPSFSFQPSALGKVTDEERRVVTQRAQHVVNSVQMRQLSKIIDLIDDILDDPQECYFICIDGLDKDWVDERIRYKMIRALIETIKDFRKVRHAKIVVSLRLDLLKRVYRHTRDSGFQEEKYESLYLPVTWSRQRLIEMLDRRIDYLIREKYRKTVVSHKEILPGEIGGVSGIDYFLSRTMMRPRDVIQFFNKCIESSAGRAVVNHSALLAAEGIYSRLRLRSLGDEWSADYLNLVTFVLGVLSRKPAKGHVSDVPLAEIEELALDDAIRWPDRNDVLSFMARKVTDLNVSSAAFRSFLFSVFHQVGIVGLKLRSTEGYLWFSEDGRVVSEAEVTDSAGYEIHPMLYRVLGTPVTVRKSQLKLHG